MRPLLPASLALILACGGLEAHTAPTAGPGGPAPTSIGPTPADPDWTFETPSDWDDSSESWRVDLRAAWIEGLATTAFAALPRELVLTVLVDDAPQLGVRTAALRAGSDPARQDWCVPAANPKPGSTDGGGAFELTLGPADLDLDQPWTWDSLALAGTRDLEDGTVPDLLVSATIPAADLAAIGGLVGDPCAELGSRGFSCLPCPQLVDECVKVSLHGATMTALDDFLLEPLNAGDVASNPDCAHAP